METHNMHTKHALLHANHNLLRASTAMIESLGVTLSAEDHADLVRKLASVVEEKVMLREDNIRLQEELAKKRGEVLYRAY